MVRVRVRVRVRGQFSPSRSGLGRDDSGSGERAASACYFRSVEAEELDDETFFRTLAASGARALLRGRRALIALGAPVMTADYDLWVHFDDIERLNTAFEAVSHFASRAPEEARRVGRYVLENGERVDVMVARAANGPLGESLSFDDAWTRRVAIEVAPGVTAQLPCIDDLIVTKRWSSRPRDLADIEWLGLVRGTR